MLYAAAAVERTMKILQVIVRALSGAITWLQAADILWLDPRSMRRWRARYEAGGPLALNDRRRVRPSRRQAPALEVQRILRLYRERFAGWNVRHFYRFARREHAVTLSYSFVRLALQEAGLVRKARAPGRHRRRREPRACFGELLHLDGSPHVWLRRRPEERQTLLTVVDDATKRLLYAQLWPAETTAAVFTALHAVCTTWGLPIALYTDRAHWPFTPPRPGAPSTASTRPRSAAPSPTSASSTSVPTRPRPGAAGSGSTAPCRGASSTSCTWRESPRARAPMLI